MELETPFSNIHNLIKTHKRINVKGNLLTKPAFDQILPLSKPRSYLPTLNQSIFDPTTSPDLPMAQIIPVKNFNMRQERSSSIGSVTKQIRMRRVQGMKCLEIQERTISRDRTCAEAIQPAHPIYYDYSHDAVPSTLRNRSVRRERTSETTLEQGPSFRGRADLARISLTPIGKFEKYPRKEETFTSKMVSLATEKAEIPARIPLQTAANESPSAKDLVFGPNVPEDVMTRHANEVAKGIRYAVNKVKPLPDSVLKPLQVSLRKNNPTMKKTLVLDLDETLICARRSDMPQKDNSGVIEINGFSVRIRPFAAEFLRIMSKEFEIIIFTAAEKHYAECMVSLLDPEQKFVSHILHREHCLKTKRGLSIKDLRIILERELKDMVIIDNFVPSFSFQVNNGIPIITWEGDQEDQELLYLMPYLLEAKKYNDMRQYNRERLRLEELAKTESP